MADPLNPVVEGDLGAFGIADRNPISVETPEPVEEAQATEAEEAPEEEQPEVQAKPEPEEGEEKPILSQLIEEEAPEEAEESELHKARMEILRLQREKEEALQERLRIAEERVLTQTEPKPEPEPPIDYLKNPAVQAVLRQVREEQPEQYEQTLIDLATQQMNRSLEEKEKAFSAELQRLRDERQLEARNAQVKQVIESTLSDIGKEGGLYSELVDDWKSRRMESFVGKKMMENPTLFYSEQGVRDAVQSLESQLRHQIEVKKSGPSTRAGVATSAGTGVASTRGINMNENPSEKTPEEEYLDGIERAGRRSKNLEFFG